MHFSINWQIPERVLSCCISGDLSSDDARSIAEQLEQHIQAGTAPVHILVDMSGMGNFPASVAQLNRMSRWVYHEKTGWIVTVNPGRLVSFVGSLVTGMAGVKYRSVNSPDEALKVLQKMDASLLLNTHE